MTPLTILTDLLQRIPAKVRTGLLVAYALAVVGTQVAEAFSVNLEEGVYRALVVIGGYLGVQSAANVLPTPPVVAPDEDADSGLAADEAPEIEDH